MTRYAPVRYPVHSRTMQAQEVTDDMREGEKISGDRILALWQSRDFIATMYKDGASGYPRLTVSRTQWDKSRDTYRDGISWDELMRVKRQVGLPDVWAVEVFPPDDETVGVHAIRHLWILNEAPPFAWTEEREIAARVARGEPVDAVPNLTNEQVAKLRGRALHD